MRTGRAFNDSRAELPRLPPEMTSWIIQLFEALARKDGAYKTDRELRRALSVCASTCREATVRFQPLLFDHLRLSSPDDVQQLATLVRANCTIGKHVHSLTLTGDRGECAHSFILLLSHRLPSLSVLQFRAAVATPEYAVEIRLASRVVNRR